MDRRVFLAVILTAVVIVVTPMLFPGAMRQPVADSLTADSSSLVSGIAPPQDSALGKAAPSPAKTTPAAPSQAATATQNAAATPSKPVVISDTLAAHSPHMTVWYAAEGGAPLNVVLPDYEARDTTRARGPVVLRQPTTTPLLEYTIRSGDSTLSLASTALQGSVTKQNGHAVVTYTGTVAGHVVHITYRSPAADAGRYLAHAKVSVDGVSANSELTIRLPSTLASMETDTLDDIRHLAYGYRTAGGDVTSLAFSKLDSGETKPVRGPLTWVAVRNKYFLMAVLVPDSGISGASFTGAPRVGKLAPDANGTLTVPMHNGEADFQIYMGPQEFERLRALGHNLDQVNPYAGWFHSIIQPFATITTQVLLWMKRTSGLSYGWVIIIFGIAVRVILWPLYQSSMRTSIRMQRLQPQLAEVQKKYKSDPKKQQEALVKLYQAHGMTPFSPMMGCLPMLLPMPILFALYFVFLNTIEFRGVSFLWMHDISAADPYYITPIVMGLSMFVLSWIGMRGTPPTAQTRMMSYMMPVVLTFMFFRFAAGLNLYYAVQNIAAIPQQWLLSKERMNATADGGGGSSGRRNKG